MDLLIISPPVANIGQAPSGISVLTSFLRARGWDVQQWDVAIDAFHHFHSAPILRRETAILHRDPRYAGLREIAARVVEDIEPAKAMLQTPGVERDRERLRRAFITLEEAGTVMTAAAHGRYRHDFRQFEVGDAFRSFADLDRVLADPERNPYLDYIEEFVLPRLRRQKPRAIGVSFTYGSQVLPGFTLIRKIREHLPRISIVAGGAYLTAVAPDLASLPVAVLPADAIIVHDGEIALDRWLQAVLARRTPLDAVPNCYLRGRSFVRTDSRGCIPTDLGALPVPMWTADGLTLERYLVPRYVIPLPLARGCHWGRCAYCNISCQTTATYRSRPVELALADIRHAVAETGSNWFDLPVDSFRPRDLHALARGLIASVPAIEWGAEVLLDADFGDEVIGDLARSGCRQLRFGLESASTETLAAMHKPIRPETARRILGACRRNGIRTAVMCIAGFPTETQAGLNQTFDYLIANRDLIDFVTIHSFSLVRGSPMARDPGRYGLLRHRPDGVLLTTLPFTNANPVAMRQDDLPCVVAAMKEALKDSYPDLGELWSTAIGGWMTFPFSCGRQR